MLISIIILYYVLFFITLIYGLYYVITSFIGLIKKNKIKYPTASIFNKFAIIIPARNEALVIEQLINSLNNLNYPKNKYDIYVIPNNCTDNTKEIVEKKGVHIIECREVVKTKGDVLKFVFNNLKDNKKIDAYIIFDADNVVHPDFLMHMNNCLSSGYRVAQGFRDAKNPSDNWISGSYTLYYLMQNVLFNYTRMPIGGSASINGTGFMVKKEIIDEWGFETFTLTEDMEFTGICALKGERIAFVENAITYDEYPTKFVSSWNQRKRWSAGILECMKKYSNKLFINFFKKKKIASLDMGLTYMCPIIQVLSFISFVMLMVFKIFGIELHDIFSYIFASGFICFFLTYLIGIIIEIWILKFKRKKIKTVISGIFLFALFIFSWIPINIVCLLKKHTKWDEIKHDRNIDINDVIKNG